MKNDDSTQKRPVWRLQNGVFDEETVKTSLSTPARDRENRSTAVCSSKGPRFLSPSSTASRRWVKKSMASPLPKTTPTFIPNDGRCEVKMDQEDDRMTITSIMEHLEDTLCSTIPIQEKQSESDGLKQLFRYKMQSKLSEKQSVQRYGQNVDYAQTAPRYGQYAQQYGQNAQYAQYGQYGSSGVPNNYGLWSPYEPRFPVPYLS